MEAQDKHNPGEVEPTSADSQSQRPTTDLKREDNRWRPDRWFRDWAILLVMILIYLVWTGLIYTLEPGIR